MIDDTLRSQLKREMRKFLKQTCTIEARASGSGTFGEQSQGWTVVRLNEPCRVLRGQGARGIRESIAAGADTIKAQYTLIVGDTVALATDQRVTVNGQVFYIAALETQMTDQFMRTAYMVART